MTFDIYDAPTYELKKSSKSKFGAKFVATITDFGEAARQKSFFKNPSLIRSHFSGRFDTDSSYYFYITFSSSIYGVLMIVLEREASLFHKKRHKIS